jgi:pyruvate/2-oxoacid:ferredoxin oxidoreductase alpha subunit
MTSKVLDGNRAAAYGVLLSQPDVVAVYPITPQTALVEQLARFHAEGLLKAEFIEVEGENSSMGIMFGASAAGGRVFTATSSWGLAFMNDGMMYCAGQRLPVVMVNATRETPSILAVAGGRQDIVSIRDAGWIQIDTETCQEILDSILMAYRLAEDPDILLPVVISYDGFYLSYLSEPVEIPGQEAVDRFFAPVADLRRLKVVPGEPVSCGTICSHKLFAEYRYKHCAALERVKTRLEAIEEEFASLFGRSYGGLVETYCVQDAEVMIITAGSCTGTARVVVDQARKEGQKVGLARIRVFRPFPFEKLRQVLQGKKAVGVIDQSVCLGWNCGHLFMELKAALPDIVSKVPVLDFIDGLANLDITKENIGRVVEQTIRAMRGEQVPEVTWLPLE